MAMYTTKKPSSNQAGYKGNSPSVAVEEGKKKTSLLKDGSWIRKDLDEDEPVGQDSNFGKVVLHRLRSNESVDPTDTTTATSSVLALSKRFGGSQDQLENKSSTLPSNYSRTTTYTTKSSSSTLKYDEQKIITTSRTIVSEDPNTSNTLSKTTVIEDPRTSITNTAFKDGTDPTITISTDDVIRSPGPKTPTKTNKFTERVFSDPKSPTRAKPSTLPAKPTISTTTNKRTEDELFDTLLPSSMKIDNLPPNRTSSGSRSEVVTVVTDGRGTKGDGSNGDSSGTSSRTSTSYSTYGSSDDLPSPRTSSYTISSSPIDGGKTDPSSTTRTSTSYTTYSSNDDLPSSRTSSYTISSSPRDGSKVDSSGLISTSRTSTSYTTYSSSDDLSSSRTSSYSVSSKPSYDYSSTTVSSPGLYSSSSYKDRSLNDDYLTDSVSSKTIKSIYASPERAVLEKDLCSYCRKPMNTEAKMVLEDMQINCHASCFKCEVCHSPLGHLKAGDSLWIYRRAVNCENCFSQTREKWRR